jgi:hypothetical protein
MATIGDASILIDNVYYTMNGPNGPQLMPNSPTSIPAGWTLNKIVDNTAKGGDYAAVYVNDTTKEVFIAGRGTASASDISPDLSILAGTAPALRNAGALAIYQSVKDDTSLAGYTIQAGGHSLDGEAWAYVSAQTGIDALVINAPNTSYTTLGSYGQSHIMAINDRFDIVGNYGPSYANLITIDNQVTGGFFNQLGTHSALNMALGINQDTELASQQLGNVDPIVVAASGVYGISWNGISSTSSAAEQISTVVNPDGSITSTLLDFGNSTQSTLTADTNGTTQTSVTPIQPSGSQTLRQGLNTTADALGLIQAIQAGKPLPITVSGLNLVNQVYGGASCKTPRAVKST